MGSPHILQQVTNTRVRFLAAWQDLICRKHKSVQSRIPELRRERIIGTNDVVHVINAAARRLVDGGADRTVIKRCPMYSGDSLDGT